MVSKKNDSARQSNVSMAQFVYDGSDADTSTTSLRPAPGASSSRSKPTPSVEVDAHRPADSASAAEKDKKDSKEGSSKDNVTIEDLNLPRSIITRLAKGVLPPNTQIQANAVLAMSKSATVFINHLANAANEHTQNSNKKTIMPADVFAALEDIEFPFLRERLEAEFKKFNEVQTNKRNLYRRRVAAAKKAGKPAAVGGSVDPNASMVSNATSTATADKDAVSSTAPRSKKQKPNAPDDSAMDVDGDEGATQDMQDASDAETEPEQEDEEDENEGAEEDDEDDEEEDEEEDDGNEGADHDHLEAREPHDEHDDALDDEDSD
ncbi:histone-fold-containing protein [Hypoxylon crocopeplum]|nr:histone-fold-containing protein [Hypoxylon crocopeplum]